MPLVTKSFNGILIKLQSIIFSIYFVELMKKMCLVYFGADLGMIHAYFFPKMSQKNSGYFSNIIEERLAQKQ